MKPTALVAFKSYIPTAKAVSELLHPYAEVIIHDFKTKKIVAIFNGFSKREVGDESLLEEDFDYKKIDEVLGPYPKMNWDGRSLKSVTSILYNAHHEAIGLMCINLDISAFDHLEKFVQSFLKINAMKEQPLPLFKNDWREKINQYIGQFAKERTKSISALSKLEQVDLVHQLQQDGAFEEKNAAQYISSVLGISRASVYNYLRIKS